MRNFRSYDAYQFAFDLSSSVLETAAAFPRHDRYELTSQLRRSAISVPSNIAEGAGRRTATDFAKFLSIALGSLNEMDCQMDLADRLGYVPSQTMTGYESKSLDTRRLLIALTKTVLGICKPRAE